MAIAPQPGIIKHGKLGPPGQQGLAGQAPDSELEDQWSALLAHFGVPAPLIVRSFAEITRRYQAPGRHYHNLAHLRYALGRFQKLKPGAREPRLVQLAIWYHDLGYRPYGRANDCRSALGATDWLTRFKLSVRAIDRVCKLIEVTRNHDPGPLDPDARIISDVDLAVLGGASEEYEWYRAGLRREYRLVPGWLYRPLRRGRLGRLLARHRIFFTDAMYEEREGPARVNLRRELEMLKFLG